MIVCSCNRLTDKDVREALAGPNPPERVRDVYARAGCAPKCGGCAGSINRLINEAKADRDEAALAPAERDAA